MITFPSNYPSATPIIKYIKPKQSVLKTCKSPTKKIKNKTRQYTQLTPRIKEVLILKAQGFSHQRVAEELELSIKTVEKHIEHGYNILGLNSVVILVHYALYVGWIKNLYAI